MQRAYAIADKYKSVNGLHGLERICARNKDAKREVVGLLAYARLRGLDQEWFMRILRPIGPKK